MSVAVPAAGGEKRKRASARAALAGGKPGARGRKPARLAAVWCALALAAALYGYARFVEPRSLRVETLALTGDALTAPLTIVAFSDTHIGNGFSVGDLSRLVGKINAQNPDIVVFLGDLIDNPARFDDRAAVVEALRGLTADARLAVPGNHDRRTGDGRFADLMADAGFTVLADAAVALHGVVFTGADDRILGDRGPVPEPREGAYNILLVHEPDFADEVSGFALQLSGHTHGAQVRPPFTEGLWLPAGGRIYVSGRYEKPDGGIVYVTRGVGMTLFRLRFLAPPELTVVRLTPAGGR